MPSKKKLLRECKLYLILDAEVQAYSQLLEIAKSAILNGVDIVQLRDKHGSDKDVLQLSQSLAQLTKDKAIFILNDRLDLFEQSGADGIHLGQNDLPVAEVRQKLGEDVIIGSSCQTLEHVLEAQEQGADYIGFGSIFKTLTKPDRNPMEMSILSEAIAKVKIPLFAIGGISLKNVEDIQRIGIQRIAVCRAICEAEDVAMAVQEFRNILVG